MRSSVALSFIAGILSSIGSAAQTSSPPLPVPTLKANARLTLVDVTVTDSKGNPVHGLTQADFSVKEDGRPQPIKTFEVFGSDRPAEAPPPLPPDVYSNRAAATNGAVNVLLFDQVATGISYGLYPDPQSLKDAKEATAQYLRTMPAGTQVAVLEMGAEGLHLVQGFTSSQELLLAAVNSIAYQPAMESIWYPPQSPPVPGVPREKPNYSLLCNAMNFQSAKAINGLNQMALFVSGIAGRKNLLWITPGIPWLTNYQPFSRFPQIACLDDFTPQLQAVYGRLTATRAAIYPIDPRGVLVTPDDWKMNPPPGLGEITKFAGFYDNGSLDDMAKATGGKPHYSNNDLAGLLQDSATNGSDYYALSYIPPLSKYDGKYHTIEVKVDRPGVQLEYRRGYTSLDINGPLLEQEKSHGKTAPPKNFFETAMAYGAIPATQLTFAVKAVPSTAPRKPGDAPVIGSPNAELKGKPLVRYSFAFDLPRDKITLEDQPDGSRKASFELAIAAYDIQGRVLNALDERRGFTLKPDAVANFLQKPFIVPVELDLPPGNLSIHAGILDLPSQEMGIVEIPLNVIK